MSLAPYAMRVEAGQGRRWPEAPHPYRNEYQRDRDRVIHSKAFRRLENKTQVFDPDYSDHFRNRLTHTLEVSQISRTISQALGLNVDLSEALALSHDIGHPPFSHEGEKALNEIMQRFGLGFEHNLHALRIVEDFEEKYAAFRGLNLTFEVREGIIKHSRDYSASTATYIDISGYRIDERPPLEAQLIDLADEIAYNSADLDDGFDSGILQMELLYEEVELFKRHFRQVEAGQPEAAEKLKVSETIRRMIDTLASDLIEETRRRIQQAGIDSVEGVRRHPVRLAGFSPQTAALNRELKRFLHTRLYSHPALERARAESRKCIRELFTYYMENADRLPASHAARIAASRFEVVVCDYIAGMTDKFAHARYQEIRCDKLTEISKER